MTTTLALLVIGMVGAGMAVAATAPAAATKTAPAAKASATPKGPAPRFVPVGEGAVRDNSTGLIWAAKDNGTNVTWEQAKKYCDTYQGSGWRMPTHEELGSLLFYAQGLTFATQKDKIGLTSGCVWSSSTRPGQIYPPANMTRGPEGYVVDFFPTNYYPKHWVLQSDSRAGPDGKGPRALPVRGTAIGGSLLPHSDQDKR